mmetsp:Transcript_23483/g.46996  ORF Transcript_23483/g.46996 Transcript_23483/m.46996 type:complete len:286 (+) Transcript_23483:1213-2070(+)
MINRREEEESHVNQAEQYRTDEATSRMHTKPHFHEFKGGSHSFSRTSQESDPVSTLDNSTNEDDIPLFQRGDFIEQQQANILARRCMEAFVKEMKDFARGGGFQSCNEFVRKSVNNSFVDRYLGPLSRLVDTPIVVTVRQIINSFIEGKCRPMEFYIHEQIKDESPGDVKFWICAVCGKQNIEGKKIQRFCVICGREKGYAGSKKIHILNECRGIDSTPFITASNEEDYNKAAKIEKTRENWVGHDGQRKIFLSRPDDYEALVRKELKYEIASLLEKIKLCTGGD